MADVIRAALRPLDDRIEWAFVYGSLAKTNDNKSSDIDLMIVSETLAYGEVMDHLLPLESQLGRTINPTLYARDDFDSKLKQRNSFITRVMEQPKLWVKGSDDDISRTG